MRRTVFVFLSGFLAGVAGTGIAANLTGSSIFPDVPAGSYYDHAIGQIYEAGLITGYQNGRFGPDDPVTRGQLAVILQRLRAELGLADAVSMSSHSRSSRSSRSSDDSRISSSRSSSSSSASSVSSVSIGPAGAIRFTANGAIVDETAGTVKLSVVRTNGNQGTVQATYEVVADTASTDDFEVSTGTISMASKVTSAIIDIKIKDDASTESAEQFKVVLKNPTNGAVLGNPSTAIITIRDDESGGTSSSSSAGGKVMSSMGPTVGLGAVEYTVAENAANLTVTVVREHGTSGAVSVVYETVDGSAKSGTEYSGVSGTLSFAGGESSKTFQIPIVDDASIDGNTSFTVRLKDVTGSASIGTSSATVVIADNEAGAFGSGTIRFADDEFIGYESQGRGVVTVKRLGGAKGTVNVTYAASDGTARAGSDYQATSGVLTFLEGESAKTFSILLYSDADVDAGDGINLSLSNVTNGATLGTPSTAVLYIYE